MEQVSSNYGLDLISKSGTYWVRSNNFLSWARVESKEGARDWNTQVTLEQELKDASSHGLDVILVVRQTPSWAQSIDGYACSPVKVEKIEPFAKFLHDAVARYSVPPYNVKYWEIWNEPDIDYRLVDPNNDWGCWGNQDDPYYGGGYYARVLQSIYPQVKSANPQAQVLVGGLLMDCDSNNPPTGKDCLPSKFLEGILSFGGGAYFDGVSFHAYDYYANSAGKYGNLNWNSSFSTGPVLVAKSRFISHLLQAYGHADKFVINTESALICGSTGKEPVCLTQEFESTKASYAVQAYASAMAEGLWGNLWYSVLGWRASGLINSENRNPLPVFEAYQFIAKELREARFARSIQDYPGIQVYEFNRKGQRVWVLWSLDGAARTLQPASPPQFIFDIFGAAIPTKNSITVSGMPIYLEWNP